MASYIELSDDLVIGASEGKKIILSGTNLNIGPNGNFKRISVTTTTPGKTDGDSTEPKKFEAIGTLMLGEGYRLYKRNYQAHHLVNRNTSDSIKYDAATGTAINGANIGGWTKPSLVYTPKYADSYILVQVQAFCLCYNSGSDDDAHGSFGVSFVDSDDETIIASVGSYGAQSTSSNARNIGYSNALQPAAAYNRGIYQVLNFVDYDWIGEKRADDGTLRVRIGCFAYNDTTAGYKVYQRTDFWSAKFLEYV